MESYFISYLALKVEGMDLALSISAYFPKVERESGDRVSLTLLADQFIANNISKVWLVDQFTICVALYIPDWSTNSINGRSIQI